jgi:hypothetical protein
MNRSSVANVFIAGIFGLGGLLVNDNLWSPGAASFVTQAEARIGRPLTPFSVAGVARRTTRRAVYASYGYGYGGGYSSYSSGSPYYGYSSYSSGSPYYGYSSYSSDSPYYGYSSYSSGSPYYGYSSYSSGSPYYGYNYSYPYSYGVSRYPYYRAAYNWGRRWW